MICTKVCQHERGLSQRQKRNLQILIHTCTIIRIIVNFKEKWYTSVDKKQILHMMQQVWPIRWHLCLCSSTLGTFTAPLQVLKTLFNNTNNLFSVIEHLWSSIDIMGKITKLFTQINKLRAQTNKRCTLITNLRAKINKLRARVIKPCSLIHSLSLLIHAFSS